MNRKERRASKATGRTEASPPAQPLNEFFNQAFAHHQRGELGQAEAMYRQLLAAHPEHTDSLHLLGVIALQTGHYEPAIELISKAISLNGSIPAYYNNLGMALKGISRIEESIAQYRKALAINSAFPDAHNNLGNAYKEQGLTEKALHHYMEAIRYNPKHVDARNNLGIIYEMQGKSEAAIKEFREALTLKPDFVEAHNNLGGALLESGMIEEAIAQYERALLVGPGFAGTHFHLANALVARGDPISAIAQYKQAITLQPTLAAAYTNLGSALKHLGRIDEAFAVYEQAIAAVPENGEARFNLANILNERGNKEAAIAQLKRCLEINPNDPFGAHLMLAALGAESLPARASEAHLQHLYEQRAHTWHQAPERAYRGHELVANALRAHQAGSASKLDILDAGCGTGLVGLLVRDIAKKLVGVDISAPMLREADAKHIYDELHQRDLVAFLKEQPAHYDAITCAATLIHFGDLAEPFRAFATALRPGGLLLSTMFPNDDETGDNGFSVASLAGLAQGGCYAHGREYIKKLAQDNGFSVEALETHVHEYSKDQPRMGLLVVMQRSAG